MHHISGVGHASDLATFQSGTVENAAVAFRKGFERCGESEAHDEVRITNAVAAYNQFKGREIEYAVEKTSPTASSISSQIGIPSGSVFTGKVRYSYDDMYFAYYQIEQWYEQSGAKLLSQQFETVTLPEGGFAWPLSTTDGTGTDKIYRMYGTVKDYSGSHDGIDVSGRFYEMV